MYRFYVHVRCLEYNVSKFVMYIPCREIGMYIPWRVAFFQLASHSNVQIEWWIGHLVPFTVTSRK